MLMRQPVQVFDLIHALLSYLPPAQPGGLQARDRDIAKLIVKINGRCGIVGASRRPTSPRSFEQWVSAIRRRAYSRGMALQGPYRYGHG
jgi:hypothetical protein